MCVKADVLVSRISLVATMPDYRTWTLTRHCFNALLCTMHAVFHVTGSKRCHIVVLQEETASRPHFQLFYIAYGLKLIALVLSAMADVPPDLQDMAKKVTDLMYM